MIGYITFYNIRKVFKGLFKMITVIIASILVILSLILYNSRKSKYSHLASPGLCLPIIGHAHRMFTKQFKEDASNAFWDMYKKYNRNGIMHLNSFSMDLIFVGDFKTVKYLFNLPEVTARMSKPMKDIALPTRKVKGSEMPGILMSEGEMWVQQRRFALRTLRDFGFGKQGMEEMIKEEVAQFKQLIDKNISQPFNFMGKLNLPILNALWKVLVGERFEYDNPRLIDIVKRLSDAFEIFARPSQALLMSFPWVKKYFSFLFDFQAAEEILFDIADLMEENIVKHQETLDVNEPRDYIDMVLIEIEKSKDSQSSFHGQLGLDNLKVSMFDLFLAGSETTSTTLTWAALYMVRYPEIQEKIQKELDLVVGLNRTPSNSDRPNLPYTEATIMEIQRHANIVPLGVQHFTTKDVSVNGEIIPAGAMIQTMMAEILKGDHWGDGKTFRPERFLDSDGNVRKDDHFIPFLTGKRQCLGETLAKTELFLFFTGLVHQYKFLPEDEKNIPSEDSVFGITLLPKPFNVKLVNRLN